MVSTIACSTQSVFACLEHEQCVDGDRSGTCQPTGYCSFDDPSCPSGQRYGAHAGKALAGTCVDDPVAETGDPTVTSSGFDTTDATSSGETSSHTAHSVTEGTGCPEVQWHRDADGDGFGDPDEVTLACTPPSGFVEDGTDCDDSDPRVNPSNLGCPNPPSLVGWWRFDGDVGVFDDSSGHRSHGTAVGGPSPGVVGAYREALLLDGSSQAVDVSAVTTPFTTDGAPPHAGTLEAWIRSDGPTEPCTQFVNCAELVVHVGPTEDPELPSHPVDGFGPHAEAHLHLIFDDENEAWSFAMYVGNDDANCRPSSASAGLFVVDGQWTHVAGSWSDGTCRLYIDGMLVDEIPLAATPPGHWDAAIIGAVIERNRRWLHGAIDEVMIFTEARTLAEIRADCGAPQCQP